MIYFLAPTANGWAPHAACDTVLQALSLLLYDLFFSSNSKWLRTHGWEPHAVFSLDSWASRRFLASAFSIDDA